MNGDTPIPGSTPGPKSSCTTRDGKGKRGFYTRAEAQHSARYLRKLGHKVKTYRCPDCGLVHVAHVESQRPRF